MATNRLRCVRTVGMSHASARLANHKIAYTSRGNDMPNGWTPESVAGIITAATALVAAVGALWHSIQTRKAAQASPVPAPQTPPPASPRVLP